MSIASANTSISSTQHQRLMEAAQQCLCVMKLDGTITEASGAVEAVTGYSTDAIIGCSYHKVISPMWQQRVEDWMQSILLQRSTVNLCMPLRRADGRVCWVEISAIVSAETDPPVYHMLVQKISDMPHANAADPSESLHSLISQTLEYVDIDQETLDVIRRSLASPDKPELANVLIRIIRDYRKIADALRGSQQRMNALLETIPDLMFVWNEDGVYTEVHTANRSVLLRSPEEIIGRPIEEVGLPSAVVEDVKFNIQQVLATGKAINYEYQLNINGKTHYFGARMARLNDHEVMGVVREITEQRLMQHELGQHIEDMMVLRQIESEMSSVLDMERLLDLALRAAIQLSAARAGFIALQEDRALVPAHAIGPYDQDQLREKCRRKKTILNRVATSRIPELIEKVSQDEEFYAILDNTQAMIVIPLVSQDQFIGILSLETDNSQRFTLEVFQLLQIVTSRIAVMLDNARLYHQIEEQLEERQRLYERVSKLEQLKTDMIRIASHDLRNPLAAISGALQMIDLDRNELDNYLGSINRATDKMHSIISGILSLERIEEVAQKRTNKVMDLSALACSIMNEKHEDAQSKGLIYHTQGCEARLIIMGDPVQLNEAISNLIGNAIKYTPTGGQVEVRLERQGERVQFLVSDTGYGIPKAQQRRLFQPFFRAKTNETRAIEGTGLGLHLVRNIVERHGGEMIFSSVYGQGSTFGFSLPLHSTG